MIVLLPMLTYIRRDLQSVAWGFIPHKFLSGVGCRVAAPKAGATFLLLLFTIMAGCAGKEILSEDAVRIRKLNVVPSPGLLLTQILPLCPMIICFTMARPRPVPPSSLLLPLSTL